MLCSTGSWKSYATAHHLESPEAVNHQKRARELYERPARPKAFFVHACMRRDANGNEFYERLARPFFVHPVDLRFVATHSRTQQFGTNLWTEWVPIRNATAHRPADDSHRMPVIQEEEASNAQQEMEAQSSGFPQTSGEPREFRPQ